MLLLQHFLPAVGLCAHTNNRIQTYTVTHSWSFGLWWPWLGLGGSTCFHIYSSPPSLQSKMAPSSSLFSSFSSRWFFFLFFLFFFACFLLFWTVWIITMAVSSRDVPVWHYQLWCSVGFWCQPTQRACMMLVVLLIICMPLCVEKKIIHYFKCN